MATAGHYPANTFALQYLLNTCSEHGLRRVLEVGIGHGTAVAPLAAAGLEITGLDRDPEMVEVSRQAMADAGQDPDRVVLADIEDPMTYPDVMRGGPYDAILGLGIMPTARNEGQTLRNIAALVRPGGHVFLEYRNVLFSLVTFNRHTHAFIVDELLEGVDPEMKAHAAQFVAEHVNLAVPPVPASPFPPKYHNPLTVLDQYADVGLEDARPFYFHYHPGAPALEKQLPDLFHAEAMRLEHENSGWKGMFLCSAFLAHARRAGTN